jgi:hypothetical protein
MYHWDWFFFFSSLFLPFPASCVDTHSTPHSLHRTGVHSSSDIRVDRPGVQGGVDLSGSLVLAWSPISPHRPPPLCLLGRYSLYHPMLILLFSFMCYDYDFMQRLIFLWAAHLAFRHLLYEGSSPRSLHLSLFVSVCLTRGEAGRIELCGRTF